MGVVYRKQAIWKLYETRARFEESLLEMELHILAKHLETFYPEQSPWAVIADSIQFRF